MYNPLALVVIPSHSLFSKALRVKLKEEMLPNFFSSTNLDALMYSITEATSLFSISLLDLEICSGNL